MAAPPRTRLCLLLFLSVLAAAVAPAASAHHVWVPNSLPQNRIGSAAVFANGFAYVIGGAGCPGTYCGDILRYDPASGANPVAVASLPSARAYPSAAFDGSHFVYIFGGQLSGGGYTTQVVRFDTNTNAITTLSSPSVLPTARGFTAAAWVNGNAYVFGGLDGSGTRLGDILKFNPANGVSNTGQSLQQNMYGIAAVATGSSSGSLIYLYGGDGHLANGPTTLVQKYDPGANLRTTLFGEAMPHVLSLAAATWDPTVGAAFIFGGEAPSDTNQIMEHSPGASPFTLSATLPSARSSLSAALDNRHTVPASLVFGGSGVSDVVRYSPNNRDPVASISGFAQPAECNGGGKATFTLNSASSDPDSDPFTLLWTGTGVFTPTNAASTSGAFPLGSESATLTVNDGEGHSSAATQPFTAQDSQAPTTTATPSGTAGDNGWYRSGVTVSFSATDACGGATTTFRRLDGGSYAAGTSLSVSADGAHTVDYYSQDAVPNAETPRSLAVNVDTVAPATTASVSGTSGLAGWYVSAATLTFTASDATSGVAATFCSIDGGAATTGSTCLVSADGAHTVTYWSKDSAGNTESTHSVAVNVDKTAPVTGTSIAGTAGSAGWYRSSVTVTLLPTDPASGVASTVSSLDGGPSTVGTSVAISGDGTHTLTYRSTDVAGNVEATRTLTVKIDTVTPTVTMTSPEAGGLYTFDVKAATPPLPITTIVGGKTVTATASDVGSGIERVDFLVDNTLVGSATSAPYQVFYNEKLLGSGLHTITVRAYDLAGNSGSDNRQALVVGTTT